MNEPAPSRPKAPALLSLPRLEDLRATEDGHYEADSVHEAFSSFRRHLSSLQAQLKVVQAASPATTGASGHPARMDALHLIRHAAEFADSLERDAHAAAAAQLEKAADDIRRRSADLDAREAKVERYRHDSETERAEMINRARNEIEEMRLEASHQAKQEILDAEAKARRLIEQARHQATEMSNQTRAEVTETLDWANEQARLIVARAQEGAEKLLAAAGLDPARALEIAEALVEGSAEKRSKQDS